MATNNKINNRNIKHNIANDDIMTTRVIDDLNNFEECIMPFGKYRGTTMKQMYLQDYKYCQWLSSNIQEPRGDLIEFIAMVNKYKTF